MAIHYLKTWPDFFHAIRGGSKTFDIRREDDRHFVVGDTLVLQEYEPKAGQYTGQTETRVITHIARGNNLPDHVAVLALARVEQRVDAPAAAERRGMLRAAGIVDALDVYPRCDIESMYQSDGYREAADAIRRAAGGSNG